MFELLGPEQFVSILGDVFSTQVAQFGIAFSLAAWIHAGRVRKEIVAQLTPMTQAIIDLGAALRQDLKMLSERTGKVEEGLTHLNGRVKKIENQGG